MKNTTTLLFHPFEKYSETILLPFGIIFTILGTLLGFYFDARFDGVLDMHFVKTVTLQEVVLDNLINIFCLFIFLFGVAKFINSKTRFIDILNTILISRMAVYLFTLLPKPSEELTKKMLQQDFGQITSSDIFVVMVVGFVGIIFLICYITLLYNGFKTASNAKKILPIILFVASILFSEILSKLLIFYFN